MIGWSAFLPAWPICVDGSQNTSAHFCSLHPLSHLGPEDLVNSLLKFILGGPLAQPLLVACQAAGVQEQRRRQAACDGQYKSRKGLASIVPAVELGASAPSCEEACIAN